MHKFSPPKWADRFLEWYCNPKLLEAIQGDAYELFDRTAQSRSKRAADISLKIPFRFLEAATFVYDRTGKPVRLRGQDVGGGS